VFVYNFNSSAVTLIMFLVRVIQQFYDNSTFTKLLIQVIQQFFHNNTFIMPLNQVIQSCNNSKYITYMCIESNNI